MKGFIWYGISGPYQMDEISESEMDALIKKGGDSQVVPERFSPVTKRVWPFPRADRVQVVFHAVDNDNWHISAGGGGK